MAIGFQVAQIGNYAADIDDILIRRELFNDGTMWLWGYNSYGQLGDNTSVSKSSPVTTITGGTNWKQIACGSTFTAAIKTDGTLWTWGINVQGGLGDNTTVNKSSPVTTIAGGTNWKQVACGYYHTAAIKTDGTLWNWGPNDGGQIGDNTTVNKSSPVTTAGGGTNWKQVACNVFSTAAIKTDGTLWFWGWNAYGQFGNNNTISYSSPITSTYFNGSWKQVAGSPNGGHFGAIKSNGELWMCGKHYHGQLGGAPVVGSFTQLASPVTPYGSTAQWKQVSCGYGHTAAIKTDGTLWVWGGGLIGYNNVGQLGTNNTSNFSSPVTTAGGGTNWKQVACGYFHTSAIKTDGTLWCWGNGSRLGGGADSSNYLSPVQTILGNNWKTVTANRDNGAAIRDLSI